jgi:altronate dehydratase large subunit
MEFSGYMRADGRVGVRNHVLVMPTCACSSDVARLIVNGVAGAVNFNNQHGCGQVYKDQMVTLNFMSGFAANPNIHSTLVVGLGCEQLHGELVKEAIAKKTNKTVEYIGIQETGGIMRTVEKGKEIVGRLVAQANKCRRVPCDVSRLILGTNCGGSDPTSGLSSNLVVGNVSDRLSDLGATVIISETSEFVGAEHILAKQARTPEIGRQIIRIVEEFEAQFAPIGESLRSGNPSQGNKEGGITTIEEKSLGCIHKAGSRPIEAVYKSCELVDKKGIVIMDTCAYDVCSVSEMTAGGSQITIFTTGRGTPSGNPIAPVIKITGNAWTYEWMNDFIDFDTSDSLKHKKTVQQLGEELLYLILRVASGEQVKAEKFGIAEIAIPRLCNYC